MFAVSLDFLLIPERNLVNSPLRSRKERFCGSCGSINRDHRFLRY
jgi:hypothetical protein